MRLPRSRRRRRSAPHCCQGASRGSRPSGRDPSGDGMPWPQTVSDSSHDRLGRPARPTRQRRFARPSVKSAASSKSWPPSAPKARVIGRWQPRAVVPVRTPCHWRMAGPNAPAQATHGGRGEAARHGCRGRLSLAEGTAFSRAGRVDARCAGRPRRPARGGPARAAMPSDRSRGAPCSACPRRAGRGWRPPGSRRCGG